VSKHYKIYIILMFTGTIASRAVRGFTKYKYAHAALSLDAKLKKMYSFGRKGKYNMFNAGFVNYGFDSAFFQRFNKTSCAVYELLVTKEEYNSLKRELNCFEKNVNKYRYDILGLMLRYFYKNLMVREYYYVCTQFVASVLEKSGIHKFKKPFTSVTAIDFTKIPNIIKIYEGKLKDF